ncbi:MAG: hypothetical protein JWQ40_4062 [Segetibacter sp.]|nr:hypothetical protein [Segetibacter sp.]
MQTEEPYWLEEAYTSAITALDIGLLHRNISLTPVTISLISNVFNRSGKFIDYGGGYGIFTRMMRDKGFDFYRYDIYCENLFAKHFDVSDVSSDEKFELLTAFEVFEHLADPGAELKKMLAYTDAIFFSTEICPPVLSHVKQWWYFIPTTGQHISFYSLSALNILAKKNNLNFYTNGRNLHLFTKKKLQPRLFRLLISYRFSKYYSLFRKHGSYLDEDYELIKNKDSEKY